MLNSDLLYYYSDPNKSKHGGLPANFSCGSFFFFSFVTILLQIFLPLLSLNKKFLQIIQQHIWRKTNHISSTCCKTSPANTIRPSYKQMIRMVFESCFTMFFIYNGDVTVQIGTGNDPSDNQSVITNINGYTNPAPDDVYVGTSQMWFAVIGAKVNTFLAMDVEIISFGECVIILDFSLNIIYVGYLCIAQCSSLSCHTNNKTRDWTNNKIVMNVSKDQLNFLRYGAQPQDKNPHIKLLAFDNEIWFGFKLIEMFESLLCFVHGLIYKVGEWLI